jgi:ATP-binding cassette, subfamily C, bacterial
MTAVTVRPQGGTWPMLTAFVRAYPGRSALALGGLLVAGVLDGLGLSTLLSMLTLAAGGAEEPSLPEQVALDLTAALGLDPSPLALLSLGVVFITFKAFAVLYANMQVGYTVAHVATDLRLALLRAVMASRWPYYLSQPLGQLSNAVATEAQRASEAFLLGAQMVSLVLHAIIYLTLALLISWQASLATMIAGAILLTGLNVLVRVAGRAGRKQTLLMKALLTTMTEQLTAIKPLKAMAREDRVDEMLAGQTNKLQRALRRQVLAKEALSSFQEPVVALLIGVGFFVALVHLELALSAAVVLLFLLARAMNFVAKAQRSFQNMAICESAYWSLYENTQKATAERESTSGHVLPTLKSAIRLENVSFAHPATPILKRESLTIPAGQLTVVTGPSGAGKTTLLDLVVGLLRPDSGRILIDEVPLETIDMRSWRRAIGYIPQEALLINDTVVANVTLGDPDIDTDQVRRALEAAHAWEFVSQLSHGMETELGERGGKLSGGQRQRLAIARALVRKPQLLILDEATSNLDPESEAAVLETIVELKGQLTMLAVTHETAMLGVADRVVQIRGGRVQEQQVVHG